MEHLEKEGGSLGLYVGRRETALIGGELFINKRKREEQAPCPREEISVIVCLLSSIQIN